jgi:hypothetical protein
VTYPTLSSALKPEFASKVNPSTITAENFNPYMVSGSRDQHQFYRIDGTDQVIQIYSDAYATTLFSDYLINKKNQEKLKK